jgi:hypothetical protein
MHKEAKHIQEIIKLLTGLFLIIFITSIMFFSKTGQSASARTLLSPFPTQIRTEPPPPTSTPSPPPCTSWNLASDFRISPNQENPNRDSCNNLGIWEFMGSTSLTRDPLTYYRASTFIPATGGYTGLDFWFGTYQDSNGRFPGIGFNGSGQTRVFGNITFPVNAVDIHPAPNQMGIIAWHSPISGYISVTGGVSDNDPGGGDGILWYIDQNSTGVASGGISNGGSQAFASGLGGANLNTISVVAGDVIYLVIHPNGNYYYDNTRIDIAINVTSAPTSTPTATITYTPTRTLTPTSTATSTPLCYGGDCDGLNPETMGCGSNASTYPNYRNIYDLSNNLIGRVENRYSQYCLAQWERTRNLSGTELYAEGSIRWGGSDYAPNIYPEDGTAIDQKSVYTSMYGNDAGFGPSLNCGNISSSPVYPPAQPINLNSQYGLNNCFAR